MKYKFVIVTWYDTITPESAANGDYAECGCDEKMNGTNSILEAARWHAEALRDMGYYEINNYRGKKDYAGDVAYAVDPDTDYSTGAEDYQRVAVHMPDLDFLQRDVKLRRIYNKLVERALARG